MYIYLCAPGSCCCTTCLFNICWRTIPISTYRAARCVESRCLGAPGFAVASRHLARFPPQMPLFTSVVDPKFNSQMWKCWIGMCRLQRNRTNSHSHWKHGRTLFPLSLKTAIRAPRPSSDCAGRGAGRQCYLSVPESLVGGSLTRWSIGVMDAE